VKFPWKAILKTSKNQKQTTTPEPNMNKHTVLPCAVAGLLGCASAVCAEDKAAPATPPKVPAQPIEKATAFKKPAWVSDLSLAVKESYDDNIYGAGADRSALPNPLPPPPAGSALALKGHSSWVTLVSPKVGIDLVPALGEQKTFQALAFNYSPDFAVYHDASTESYDAHRFNTSIKAKVGDISGSAENGFVYVHGSKMAPFYPGGMYSVFGIAVPRERREQFQDRSTVTLRFNFGKAFIRPTASLLYYDLNSVQMNVPGYLNFSDRYDLNGGADLGYSVTKQLAATLGYRYGHQYQEKFSFSPYSSSSDYNRLLLGVEGKPWKWLELRLQGGPDFRNYQDTTPTHITPIDDPTLTTYYGEANATATITPRDVVTFKYKAFQWVASTGKVPYFDSCYDLSYRRTINKETTLDLGAKLSTGDYTSGNLPACQRIDWQYSVFGSVSYTINRHASLNLGGSMDLGRNALDSVKNPHVREYERNQVSLSMLFKL
jgi:hypothetical protein